MAEENRKYGEDKRVDRQQKVKRGVWRKNRMWKKNVVHRGLTCHDLAYETAASLHSTIQCVRVHTHLCMFTCLHLM